MAPHRNGAAAKRAPDGGEGEEGQALILILILILVIVIVIGTNELFREPAKDHGHALPGKVAAKLSDAHGFCLFVGLA